MKFFRDKGLIKNEEDLLDPKTNIACCVEILKYYKDVGDELDMLYCYQNGEGTWRLTSRVNIEKDALLNRVVETQKKYNYYCGDYLGKMKILEWKFEPCLIDRIGRNVFLSEEEALNYIKSKE